MEFRAKSFPIRSGTCHLYADRLEITFRSFSGTLIGWAFRRGLHRVSVVYLLLIIAFLTALGATLYIQNYFLALFFLLAALFSLWMMWTQRKVSFAPVLTRDQIDFAEYLPAVPGQKRASFVIYFTNKKGKRLQRIVYLPSASENGEMIAQSAYYMMRDAGFLKA